MSNSIGFEAGVLIAKASSEFESYAINKQLNYGFFDDVSEKITPSKKQYDKMLEKQKERAREYVKDNVNGAYAIVSYQNKNLGWIKCVKGNAKNHYPKGLRHLYPLNEF